jgi:hypothetical protein
MVYLLPSTPGACALRFPSAFTGWASARTDLVGLQALLAALLPSIVFVCVVIHSTALASMNTSAGSSALVMPQRRAAADAP